MGDVMKQAENRFLELAERAEEWCCAQFSEFLNMEEQSALALLKLKTPHRLWGGYENAERCIAVFGEAENSELPLAIIKAEPLNRKFADALSHRDFLGSLMGLGIRREVIGDIVISENVAYIFCLSSIAEYIMRSLGKVKHTSVKCSCVDALPENAQAKPQEQSVIVASERLDVLIAAVCKLSRNQVKELFGSRRIFVNSALCENFSFLPKEGDVISVRGFGRFVYCGVQGKTKKGRLAVDILLYK